MPILCERYTTSKLHQLDDLSTLQTFGFRGEALASISTVSHVMVITKRDKDVCGWKWSWEGSLIVRARYSGNTLIDGKIEPTAALKGTSITVDDLFYNIPLRQSMYSQKESDETKFIISLMQIFSIYYAPKGISFTLKEVIVCSLCECRSRIKPSSSRSLHHRWWTAFPTLSERPFVQPSRRFTSTRNPTSSAPFPRISCFPPSLPFPYLPRCRSSSS